MPKLKIHHFKVHLCQTKKGRLAICIMLLPVSWIGTSYLLNTAWHSAPWQKSVGIFIPSFMILFMHFYARQWCYYPNPLLEKPKVAMLNPNMYLINSIKLKGNWSGRSCKPLCLQVMETQLRIGQIHSCFSTTKRNTKSKGRHNDQNKFEWQWCNSFDTVDGRNPAPVDKSLIPLFTWFYTSRVGFRRISEPSTVGLKRNPAEFFHVGQELY